MNHNSKTVVFGAGSLGRTVCEMVPGVIDFFVDNDESKVNGEIHGIPIKSVEVLKQYSDINIYIASQYFNEIKTQLKGYGFVEDKDFWHYAVLMGISSIGHLPVDYGNLYIPESIRHYEQTYDQESGGYISSTILQKQNFANVELEVGRLYYAFVNMVGAKYILETGTNTGYSTAMLAAALKRKSAEGMIYTIDTQDIHKLFDFNGLGNIKFILGDSLSVDLPEGLLFDIIVIDSDHTYHTVMKELIRCEPLLRVGGYILMHDSLYFDSVGLAVGQLYENPRFEVITFETPRYHKNKRCTGLSVIRKNSDDEKYPLKFIEEYKDIYTYANLGDKNSEAIIEKKRAANSERP